MVLRSGLLQHLILIIEYQIASNHVSFLINTFTFLRIVTKHWTSTNSSLILRPLEHKSYTSARLDRNIATPDIWETATIFSGLTIVQITTYCSINIDCIFAQFTPCFLDSKSNGLCLIDGMSSFCLDHKLSRTDSTLYRVDKCELFDPGLSPCELKRLLLLVCGT